MAKLLDEGALSAVKTYVDGKTANVAKTNVNNNFTTTQSITAATGSDVSLYVTSGVDGGGAIGFLNGDGNYLGWVCVTKAGTTATNSVYPAKLTYHNPPLGYDHVPVALTGINNNFTTVQDFQNNSPTGEWTEGIRVNNSTNNGYGCISVYSKNNRHCTALVGQDGHQSGTTESRFFQMRNKEGTVEKLLKIPFIAGTLGTRDFMPIYATDTFYIAEALLIDVNNREGDYNRCGYVYNGGTTNLPLNCLGGIREVYYYNSANIKVTIHGWDTWGISREWSNFYNGSAWTGWTYDMLYLHNVSMVLGASGGYKMYLNTQIPTTSKDLILTLSQLKTAMASMLVMNQHHGRIEISANGQYGNQYNSCYNICWMYYQTDSDNVSRLYVVFFISSSTRGDYPFESDFSTVEFAQDYVVQI